MSGFGLQPNPTQVKGGMSVEKTGFDMAHNPATKNADGGMGHPLFAYFGEPNGDMNFLARDKRFERNLTLPKAYEGQSVFLNELVKGLLLHDQEWYTAEPDGLPIAQTDQMNFNWSSWHFNTPMLSRVPEEGVPRLIRSTYSARSTQVQRFGLGFIVEHGFFKTAKGQQHYVRSLQQISNASQVTMNYDVLIQLLLCREYDREWMRRNGALSKPVDEIIKETVKWTACLQKDETSAALLIDKKKVMFSERNVTPTTLIIPQGAEYYFRGVGPQMTEYYRAGPAGPRRLQKSALDVNTFAKLRVRVTRTYNVFEGNESLDPLTRARMFGNYYHMYDKCSDVVPADEYRTSMRTIYIHDANRDEMMPITLQDAIRNCGRWVRVNKNVPPTIGDYGPLKTVGDRTDDMFYSPNPSVANLRRSSMADYTNTVHTLSGMVAQGYIPQSMVRIIKSKFSEPGATMGYMLATTGVVAGSVSGSTTGPEFVLARTTPKLFDNIRESGKSVGQAIGFDTHPSTIKAVEGAMNSSTTESIGFSKEETDALHKDNIKYFENPDNVDPSIAAAAKYNGIYGTLGDEDKQAGFVGFVNKSIKNGPDAVKEHVLKNMDLVGKPQSKSWKNITQSMMIDAPVRKAVAAHVEGFFPKRTVQSNPGCFIGIDAVAKSTVDSLDKATTVKSNVGVVDTEEHVDGGSILNGSTGPNSHDWVDAKGDKFIGVKINGSDYTWDKSSKFKNVIVGAPVVGEPVGLTKEKQLLGNGDILSTIVVCEYNFLKMADNNIPVPLHFLLFRPFQEFDTSTAIMAKMGGETGNTLIGHTDFMLSDDGQTKRHLGNFTLYMTVAIWNPDNVTVIDDIMIKKYKGGRNTVFMSDEYLRDLRANGFITEEHLHRPSIISICEPATTTSHPHYLDIRGSHDDNTSDDTVKGAEDYHYHSAPFYKREYGFSEMSDRVYYNTQDVFVNSLVIQGHQEEYNHKSGEYNTIVTNKGHLGINVYSGMMNVLEGNSAILLNMEYEKHLRRNYIKN